MPLVSIIIPMYNAELFIKEALMSLLGEKQIPIELIVVNDKSTDNSLGKVISIKDSRIRIVNGERRGIAACFNMGLSHVRGNIVMRCDADDMYPPGRIKRQVDWLCTHPTFGAICGGFSTVDIKGGDISLLATGDESAEITDELCHGTTRTHYCTFAVKKEVLKSVKGMREYFITAEDIDCQLRIGENCRVWFEPTNNYLYRLHQDSITHSQPDIERVFFEKIARQFQEQRSQCGYDALQKGIPPMPPKGERNITKSVNKQIQGMLLGNAWQEHAKGNKIVAVKLGFRSLLYTPQSLKVWRSFVAILLKKSGHH